jgi:hypothetical protein
MLDLYKSLIVNQFEAALATLGMCIDRCPESLWNSRVARYPFSQTAFHTLFFTDFYLGANEDSFRRQPFHRENKDWFAEYEQLEDREPASTYEKSPIHAYLEHCRRKATEILAAETEASLNGLSGFPRRNFSRAELHVYNIRHIQHHAAQLILRLRLDAKVDVPWLETGWR